MDLLVHRADQRTAFGLVGAADARRRLAAYTTYPRQRIIANEKSYGLFSDPAIASAGPLNGQASRRTKIVVVSSPVAGATEYLSNLGAHAALRIGASQEARQVAGRRRVTIRRNGKHAQVPTALDPRVA